MNRNSKNLWLGFATLVAGLLSLAINHSGIDQNLRTLRDLEMRRSVKGGLPAPDCTTNFLTAKCGDYQNWCFNKPDGNCYGNCIACSTGANAEQICTSVKPWNALTCTQGTSISGGCGTYLMDCGCQFNTTKGICQCRGAAGTGSCDHLQATSTGVGSCNIIVEG